MHKIQNKKPVKKSALVAHGESNANCGCLRTTATGFQQMCEIDSTVGTMQSHACESFIASSNGDQPRTHQTYIPIWHVSECFLADGGTQINRNHIPLIDLNERDMSVHDLITYTDVQDCLKKKKELR